jgi:hypothetical protein
MRCKGWKGALEVKEEEIRHLQADIEREVISP